MVLSVIFSKLAYFYIKSKILLGLQYKIITTTTKKIFGYNWIIWGKSAEM